MPRHLHGREMGNELHNMIDCCWIDLRHTLDPYLGLFEATEPNEHPGSQAFNPMLDTEAEDAIDGRPRRRVAQLFAQHGERRQCLDGSIPMLLD